jgi:cysteine desulfurase / selenocysteine lyase
MNEFTLDVLKIRKDFSGLNQSIYNKPLIYLDNAATAQKPQIVIDEINSYYKKFTGNVNRGAHFLSEAATAKYQQARSYIAEFIGAKNSSQIVFTRSTTESINLIAHGLGKIHFKEGDEIILTEMEHHANIVPWYLLAKERNLKLKVVPILDDGSLDHSILKKLFNHRTKLFAFAHASNVLGTINPVKELIDIAKNFQVPTLIDGAQAIHHLPVDVNDLDVDFYCFSGHKAYGPTGIGVLYAKEKWLFDFPPYQGGGDMIRKVSFDNITFADPPQKFEAGTPNIAGVLGLKKALEYISNIGLKNIHVHEKSLHDYAASQLEKFLNVKIIGTAKDKVSLISFVIEGVHPHDISSIFDRQGIAIRAGHLCAQPLMKRFGVNALSRASMAFYNTKEEIDHFINAFLKIFEVFKL